MNLTITKIFLEKAFAEAKTLDYKILLKSVSDEINVAQTAFDAQSEKIKKIRNLMSSKNLCNFNGNHWGLGNEILKILDEK